MDAQIQRIVDAMLSHGLRPFNNGEFVQNADGSYSTERTRTVEMPGGYANVPSLWMGNQGPQDLGQTQDALLSALAKVFEDRSGQRFRRHRALGPAVEMAERRSQAGGAGSQYHRYQK